MTIDVDSMIKACEVIATQENLDVCITESLKGSAMAGIGAFAFGVLMGPLGIAVGGALGGIAGSSMCRSYKPLVQILSEMSQADKLKLNDHMMRIVQSLDITDTLLLMSIVSDPTSVARETMARELCSYFGAALSIRN